MKQIVVGCVAFLAYWFGVDVLFYWLNRKAKRIITFHNILPDNVFDPRANGVSCKESDFRKILDEVSRKFTFSTNIWDVDTVTLTFDDGFLNQYEVGGAVLAERGIPAIIFPAEEVIDSKPENTLSVDLLLHWCWYAPLDALVKAFHLEGVDSRTVYWEKAVWPAFCSEKDGRGHKLLKRLDAIYSIEKILQQLTDEYKRLRLSGVNTMMLDELRVRGWIVGWHSKTHFPLSSLSDADIQNELDSPMEYRNVVLSYPYGELQSVDTRVLRIAEELGYPCAVSNLPTVNELTSKYFLPRMALPSDKYRLHFRLSGLEFFVKTYKLLPII